MHLFMQQARYRKKLEKVAVKSLYPGHNVEPMETLY